MGAVLVVGRAVSQSIGAQRGAWREGEQWRQPSSGRIGGDAIQAIRTASQAHYHLSAMADRKASTVDGRVDSWCSRIVHRPGHGSGGELPLAMLVLGVTAFLAGG